MVNTENLIINGNFDLWQRGITFAISPNAKYSNIGSEGSTLTAETKKIADRWYAIDTQLRTAGSTGQITIYKENLVTPNQNILGNANNYLTVENQITEITGGYLYIENKQQDAKTLMNVPITLTFAVKSLNGITGITMSCYYRQAISPNETENSFESSTVINVLPYWRTFSVNFNVQQINLSGLSGDNYFGIGFKLKPETSISLASVKVQPTKSESSSFLVTDPEEEKLKQSKYYFTTYAIDTVAQTKTLVNGNDFNAFKFTVNPNYTENFKFTVPMYKNPTINLYSPNSGIVNDAYNKTATRDMRLTSGTRGWNLATRFSPTGAATLVATGNTYGVQLDVSSGAVIFDDILVHIIADADIDVSPYDRGLET